MNIQLKKFDPSRIANDKVCVVIGKRGTGKSTLVTDLLWHKRNIPAGVVMSATEEGNHYYKQFVPDLFIYGDYNKETIEKVIERQKKLISQKRDIPTFILLDDCMYNKSFMKDSCIRQCFMNGRHWKIFFVLTMQYCMDLSPDLRANVDYVFILRENVIQNRERLWKSFFGVFPSFELFNQVMNACTENYECLVLDNTSKSNKLEDCVFYYKAPIRRGFRVGSAAMWQYHQQNYNPGDPRNPPVTKKTRVANIIKT
jgi:hypothetical protein